MRHRILAWVATLVGGTIILILVSLLVITRSAAKGTDISSPGAADTLPPAGLPGTTDAPAPKRDTTVAPEAQKHDPNEVIPNPGPLDRTLIDLDRGPRQRAAMDIVLRKGIFYQVKEIKPEIMRVILGSGFYSEPEKYRNPLVRDLYHAYNDGRQAKEPYRIEFWSMEAKLGEYVSDTFFIGPGYSKPR
jgi:hypothetical protein